MTYSEFNKVYKSNIENGRTTSLKLNDKYWTYLLLLFQEGFDMTAEERNEWVSMLCDEYYGEVGYYPPERMLSCMADLLLYDSLKDRASHKVLYDEYVILSANQLKRRYAKEFSMVADSIEFFHAQETYNFPSKRKTQDAPEGNFDYAHKYQRV
jgi:hypothetical protein